MYNRKVKVRKIDEMVNILNGSAWTIFQKKFLTGAAYINNKNKIMFHQDNKFDKTFH